MSSFAGSGPTSFDLVGRWEATIDVGKAKFRVDLNVNKSVDGKRLQVTLDLPDQGTKDVPVNALLYHQPDVRLEIDAWRLVFSGKLSGDGKAMSGDFVDGTRMTFKRLLPGAAAEPRRSYAPAAGEPADFRGYWLGRVESDPGVILPLGLKIGRLPDGTLEALLDDFEHGTTDVPAGEMSVTNGVASMNWPLSQMSFEGGLGPDGRELAGKWHRGDKAAPVAFKRLDRPAAVFPEGTSFVPDAKEPGDLRGDWRGTIESEGQKQRLVLRLGRLPDANYAATLNFPDMGGNSMLASHAGVTNSIVRIEYHGIHSSYTATLNASGTALDGKWEDGGSPKPLSLTRDAVAAGDSATGGK